MWVTASAMLREASEGLAGLLGVRIVRLSGVDRSEIEAHLLQLDPVSRANRFMGFTRDLVLGARIGLSLVGVVHAPVHAAPGGPVAELGISVRARHRHDGIGTQLLAATVREAREQGVTAVQLRYLASNAPMAAWARSAGARISRAGAECTAVVSTAPAAPAVPRLAT
jgi:GNAT superfamily N-acetyltransferase